MLEPARADVLERGRSSRRLWVWLSLILTATRGTLQTFVARRTADVIFFHRLRRFASFRCILPAFCGIWAFVGVKTCAAGFSLQLPEVLMSREFAVLLL